MAPAESEQERESTPAQSEVVRGFRRWVYALLGGFFVGLGAVGAFFPILPTTPFLLLASYFFVRSSPRSHQWLLRSRIFGPFLRDWQQHRGVRLHVKIVAVIMIGLVVAFGIFSGKLSPPLLILLVTLASVGLIVVLKLPLVRD